MRRLVNNWLFGEVSQLMSGRLDTDVYSAGCMRLENMYVHRQGGISRRPPLKVLAHDVMFSKADRMVEFPISANESYMVLIGDGKVVIWDEHNGAREIQISSSMSTLWNATWGDLSANELQDIRYANYYDDLYLVHKRCPLLLIRKIGNEFEIAFPQVKCNQDVKKYNITLTITEYDPSVTGLVTITVANDSHVIQRATGKSYNEFIEDICSIEYDGWTAKSNGTGILFEPLNGADKYAEYKLATSDSTEEELEEAEFKFTSSTNIEFTYEFKLIEDEDNEGLVFGQDDFNDMDLNTEGNYASDIAIISEKMWLAVNGNPCRVYVSRPYATSQIIRPRKSNDTILDFIQYQIVASSTDSMKNEKSMPVIMATDTNDNVVYKGTTYSQEIWSYSDDEIKTKEDFDVAYESRKCSLTYGDQPDVRGGIPYRRVVEIDSDNPDFTIQYAFVWHITHDGMSGDIITYKVDYNKLTNSRGDYSSTVYRWKNGTSYDPITVVDHNSLENRGLEYRYFKTNDVYVNANKKYFADASSSSYVANPTQAGLSTYYEREVIFSEDFRQKVYEETGEYVLSTAPTVALDTEYDKVNGRILSISSNGTKKVEAIPYYQFNIMSDSDIYETNTDIKRVATASTGMEFQVASGRNDHITWIALGDDIMVGTESAEWRLNPSVNALDINVSKYSAFGSSKGLFTFVGTDLVFLEKGNKLRLLYKDDYGLQNIELTITNPDVMEGEIIDIVGIMYPEPAIAILKRQTVDGNTVKTIVFMSVDRVNGVQAFARWSVGVDIIDIAVHEEYGVQSLLALCEDNGERFLAKFDFTEKSKFSDCECTYVKTDDTTIVSGKTYYELEDGEYVEATPTSNPKSEGLYEIAPVDNLEGYTSLMRALPFDTQMQDGSVTLGEAKNVSKIVFRCLDTGRIVTWYGENAKDRNVSRTPVCCDINGSYIGGLADFSKNVNGGTTRDLMIAVESYEDQPMTLLAMAYEVRTNRNG